MTRKALEELTSEIPVMATPINNSLIITLADKALESNMFMLNGMGITISEAGRIKLDNVLSKIIMEELK